MPVAERSGCWIHGFTLWDVGRSAGWKRGWSHRQAWSITGPSGCVALRPPSAPPTEGREGRKEQTEEPGRQEGCLEAELAACSGLLPSSARLPGNQRPLLPQGCVANTIQRRGRLGRFQCYSCNKSGNFPDA